MRLAKGKAERQRVAQVKQELPQRCERCGTVFTGRDKRFCSKDCYTQTLGLQRNPAIYDARACRECGTTFTPTFKDRRRHYCCITCQLRAIDRRAQDQRRARKRAAPHGPVDPIAVFERDGWACIVCGQPTPPVLRGTTDPAAPEPDHDIPLGRGGEHSYANVNCLCRACNQAKRLMTLAEFRQARGVSKV